MMNQILETPVNRWFTDGSTMNYRTPQRTLYWFVNMAMFFLLNMFDLRIRTGFWIQIDTAYTSGPLIPTLLSPLNIFQYPSQILMIGLLMAMICTVPILVSLLYNVWHAIPFLLIVLIVGKNPILGLCLLVSCAAVSFEPLRFKSKFVALVLWLSPEVLYWALFSGDNPEKDVLRWAVLYAPWAMACLNSVCIFGVVITLGHFFRYRPGVLMPVFALLLAGTVLFFHFTIGMDEYDFQAKVFRNSPSQLATFQSKSIVSLLEKERAERLKKDPFLNPKTVMNHLRVQWRWAFSSGPNSPSIAANNAMIYFYSAKYKSIDKIQVFIDQMSPQNQRVADAIYYLALLHDTKEDLRTLRDEDRLRYSSDLPSAQSELFWQQLLDQYGDLDVSIEARWRLARLMAQRIPEKATESFHFEKALSLLQQAEQQCGLALQSRRQAVRKGPWGEKWLGPLFLSPISTVTTEALLHLRHRIGRDMMLLGKENRTGHLQDDQRLATFMGLDARRLNYEQRLKEMVLNSPQNDPLRDNVELAQILLIQDIDVRILRLTELAKNFEERDGGIKAMLELARLFLEERESANDFADKQEYLTQSREYLQRIIDLRAGSYVAEVAHEYLSKNPIE
jgi:hypothetical protein